MEANTYSTQPRTTDLLTTREAIAETGFSRSTLDRARRDGTLGFYTVGRRGIRFTRAASSCGLLLGRATSLAVRAAHRWFLLDTYLTGGLAALRAEAPLVEDVVALVADLLTLVPDPDHAFVEETQETEDGLARLTDALRRHPDTPAGRDAAWLEAGICAESAAERDAISAELLAD